MILQKPTVRPNAKSVPSTGMRGGLGRTLLTAFLLLSIAPLSLISFVAATQARRNLQRELEDKLVAIAALSESQVKSWLSDQETTLAVLSSSLPLAPFGHEPGVADASAQPLPASSASTSSQQDVSQSPAQMAALSAFFKEIQAVCPSVSAWLLADQEGNVLSSYPPFTEAHAFPELIQHHKALLHAESPLLEALAPGLARIPSMALMLSQPIRDSDLSLVSLTDLASLIDALEHSTPWSESGSIYLVPRSGRALKFNPNNADINGADVSSRSDATAENVRVEGFFSEQPVVRSYENHQGVRVIGAYRWLPDLDLGLLVEQAQDSALASSDELAVVLIAATLAAVLLTALIAAAVTRRITLPIVQLTATAVQIASGDLDQKVPAKRRDEIGILARAFNVMTTKLRILYEDLEQKVRERTQQLQEANAKIRYRAMQLAISAEVGRVVTSILDRDRLLSKVVELIRDCFQAYFVAIYFIDDSKQWAVFQEGSGGLGKQLKAENLRVPLNQSNLIGRAASRLEACVRVGPSAATDPAYQRFPHTRAELAVPLRIGERTIGVLNVHSTLEDAFDEDEMMVLETLSGQVSVAIENARAYAIERRAADQLRDLEELRRRFLANMSRELRMPLNNIIGFSRVILKGIDGPITDLQREDLTAVYDSGQQLLVLINDILDIAQIEAGAMELNVRQVDFGEIAHSVTPTVNALLEGRPIEFRCDISPQLPPVLADPHRVRQVLVKLLSNAAKFTQKGAITLRVWPDGNQILASVHDTGSGIPKRDRDKVFDMFRQLSRPIQSHPNGTGLGLKLSKEIVELHGGTIWLESKEGKGTTFSFSLPVCDFEDSSP